jgi:hypothetical protein
MLTTTHTREVLQAQSLESRDRNILLDLLRQIDMNYLPADHAGDAAPDERLCDLGIAGTTLDRFALTLASLFPFLRSPMDLIEKAVTVGDLATLISSKVGASWSQSLPAASSPAPDPHTGELFL